MNLDEIYAEFAANAIEGLRDNLKTLLQGLEGLDTKAPEFVAGFGCPKAAASIIVMENIVNTFTEEFVNTLLENSIEIKQNS